MQFISWALNILAETIPTLLHQVCNRHLPYHLCRQRQVVPEVLVLHHDLVYPVNRHVQGHPGVQRDPGLQRALVLRVPQPRPGRH